MADHVGAVFVDVEHDDDRWLPGLDRSCGFGPERGDGCRAGGCRRGGGDAGEFEEGVGASLFEGVAAVGTDGAGAFGVLRSSAGIDDGVDAGFERGGLEGWEEAAEANHAVGSFEEPERPTGVLTLGGVAAMFLVEEMLPHGRLDLRWRLVGGGVGEGIGCFVTDERCQRGGMFTGDRAGSEERECERDARDGSGDPATVARLVRRDAGCAGQRGRRVATLGELGDEEGGGGFGLATESFERAKADVDAVQGPVGRGNDGDVEAVPGVRVAVIGWIHEHMFAQNWSECNSGRSDDRIYPPICRCDVMTASTAPRTGAW